MLYIFDMGGVVTTTCSVDKEMEEILGIKSSEFHSICAGKNKEEDLMALCSDGKISCAEFWKLFSERSGISVQTDWWRLLFHPELNGETVNIIRELEQAGHRVVCGTNTVDSHWRNHVERGDYSYFDQTYASCFMGVSKPDPMFWKLILKAEKTLPSDAVFIDDRKENCLAAASLGIKAFQFTTAENLKQQLVLTF